jgi:peptide/nickel transport system permease protein
LRTIKIVERILAALPIMLGVCIVVFYFMRLIPGDPVDIMLGEASNVTDEELARLKSQFELDKPIHEQLISYLSRIAQGDLGYSISRSAEVKDLILEALPATVELAISSMVFALIVAIPIGIISAVKHNSLTDRVSMAGAFAGISMPAFWLGIVLMIIFAVNLKWLPTSGRAAYGIVPEKVTGLYLLDALVTGNWASLKGCLRHLILPSIALGAAPAAVITRVVRSSMLEVLRKDM